MVVKSLQIFIECHNSLQKCDKNTEYDGKDQPDNESSACFIVEFGKCYHINNASHNEAIGYNGDS
jgi:hypothetical protein